MLAGGAQDRDRLGRAARRDAARRSAACCARCLERNPKNRLHDIADARIAIDEASLAGEPEAAAVPAVRRGLGLRCPG